MNKTSEYTYDYVDVVQFKTSKLVSYYKVWKLGQTAAPLPSTLPKQACAYFIWNFLMQQHIQKHHRTVRRNIYIYFLQESWVLLDDTFLSFSLPQVELSHNFITSYSRKLILKIFGCHSWILAISLSLKDMNYNLNSQVCIAITKVEFTILQLFAPPDDEL